MKLLLAIAFGGALGALGRYFVSTQLSHWLGSNIPWGTFTVNVIGSFFLGALYEAGTLVWQPTEEVKAFLNGINIKPKLAKDVEEIMKFIKASDNVEEA